MTNHSKRGVVRVNWIIFIFDARNHIRNGWSESPNFACR